MTQKTIPVTVRAVEGHGRGLTIYITLNEKDRQWVLRKMRENYEKTGDDGIKDAVLTIGGT